MAELSARPAQEFAPRRCVVKKIAHLNDRAGISRSSLRIRNCPAAVINFPCGLAGGGATDNARLGNSAYAGQCFAAKTHRGDTEQIIIAGQFAGGVGSKRQRQIR